jgi:hypothetical protein
MADMGANSGRFSLVILHYALGGLGLALVSTPPMKPGVQAGRRNAIGKALPLYPARTCRYYGIQCHCATVESLYDNLKSSTEFKQSNTARYGHNSQSPHVDHQFHQSQPDRLSDHQSDREPVHG